MVCWANIWKPEPWSVSCDVLHASWNFSVALLVLLMFNICHVLTKDYIHVLQALWFDLCNKVCCFLCYEVLINKETTGYICYISLCM